MSYYVVQYLTLEVFTVCEIDLTSSLAYFKLNAKHIIISNKFLVCAIDFHFTFEPCSDLVREVATIYPFLVISDVVECAFTTYILGTIVSTYSHSNHARVTILL